MDHTLKWCPLKDTREKGPPLCAQLKEKRTTITLAKDGKWKSRTFSKNSPPIQLMSR